MRDKISKKTSLNEGYLAFLEALEEEKHKKIDKLRT